MATIQIYDLNSDRICKTEPESLTEQQTRGVKGGDNPGMAPPGAYEAGVSGNCNNATGSMESLIECVTHL